MALSKVYGTAARRPRRRRSWPSRGQQPGDAKVQFSLGVDHLKRVVPKRPSRPSRRSSRSMPTTPRRTTTWARWPSARTRPRKPSPTWRSRVMNPTNASTRPPPKAAAGSQAQAVIAARVTPSGSARPGGLSARAPFRGGHAVAVSKTHAAQRVRDAFAAGVRDFGENRCRRRSPRSAPSTTCARRGCAAPVGHLRPTGAQGRGAVRPYPLAARGRPGAPPGRRGRGTGRRLSVLVQVDWPARRPSSAWRRQS